MGSFKSSLFNNISSESCNQMMGCFNSVEKEYQAGDIVMDFSNKNDTIGIVESGVVSMIRIDMNGNRTILERLEEGGIFGETLAFSGASGDSYTIICEEKCVITFIPYNQITKRCSQACHHHTVLVENMLELISNKALALGQRIEVLTHRTIRDKLLCYFMLNSVKENSRQFTIPFTMTALAEYICADRSAMMREIKNMKNSNLIKINKRTVTLNEYQ